MIGRRTFLSSSIVAGLSCTRYANVCSAAGDANKINIGQIGTKHPHAAGKLDAIRKLSDKFHVVGVVEPDDQQWDRVKTKPSYKDLPRLTEEQLFNTTNLQAVAVETEVKQLVPTAMRCLGAGVHIHLDKPAGESMQHCHKMHAMADQKGLTIQMGYMLRYNPAFERLFAAVNDGWLGDITELSAAMGKKASAAARRELSQYQGGGMFELSCHLIDAVVTILGKPINVTAHNRSSQPETDRFLDNQLAVFDYPKAIATVRCNHIDPFGFPRRFFEVVGENGNLRIGPIEPPKATLSVDRKRGEFAKGTHQLEMRKSSGRYDDEFRDLAKVIRGEKKLAWDSKHDLIVHECVLRASGMSTALVAPD